MNFEFPFYRNNMYLFKQTPLQTVYRNLQPSILPQLRQALIQDLKKFSVKESQKQAQNIKNTLKPTKPSKVHPEIIDIISSDEEIENQEVKTIQFKKDDERKNIFVIKQFQEKTDIGRDQVDFEKEQSVKSQQQSSNSVAKNHLIKKQRLNKAHPKLRKHKYSKIEENLDLTETVQLKFLLLSTHELTLKRESLLQRKVYDWQESGKMRKERREIRMLKN